LKWKFEKILEQRKIKINKNNKAMTNEHRMSLLEQLYGSVTSILTLGNQVDNCDEDQDDDQPVTDNSRAPLVEEPCEPEYQPDPVQMDDLKEIPNFHNDQRNIFGSIDTIYSGNDFQRQTTTISTVSSRDEIIKSVRESLRIPRFTLFLTIFLVIAHCIKNYGKNRLIFTMLYCNDTNLWTRDTLLSCDMLTYAASHGSFSHLIINVLMILLFGSIIEQCLGSYFVGFLFLFSVYIGGLGALISGECKFKTGSDGQLEGGLHGASGGAFGLLPVILYLNLPIYKPSTDFINLIADFMYCDQKNSRFRKYGRLGFIFIIVLITAFCFWQSVGPKVALWTHTSGYIAGTFLALSHFLYCKLTNFRCLSLVGGRKRGDSNRDSSILFHETV